MGASSMIPTCGVFRCCELAGRNQIAFVAAAALSPAINSRRLMPSPARQAGCFEDFLIMRRPSKNCKEHLRENSSLFERHHVPFRGICGFSSVVAAVGVASVQNAED